MQLPQTSWGQEEEEGGDLIINTTTTTYASVLPECIIHNSSARSRITSGFKDTFAYEGKPDIPYLD